MGWRSDCFLPQGHCRQRGMPASVVCTNKLEARRNMPNFLIYGATGYTGSLIAHETVRRGARPILGGRTAEALAALARKLELEQRVFPLDAPAAVNAGLRGVSAVLPCAGPF